MPLVNPFHATLSTWDQIVIGGIAYGGLAEVEDAGRERKVDVPKKGGGDGAYLVIRRRELAKPTIILTGWTQEHFEQMDAIARAVFPLGRSEQHNAVDVSHPALLFHAIDRVFVQEIVGPETDPAEGTFTLTLKTHEYFPPPPRNTARRATRGVPISQRATAFTGVGQPTPPATPSQTAAPRRRTP